MTPGESRNHFLGVGLDDVVAGPDHADYDRLRRVWNGIADRRPAAIVRARNADDVARTVALAAERALPLAVRCGGHSLPGLSTCDGGIVLDLSGMKRVSVDPVQCIAEVDGGALLGDLDRAGADFGLVTPAGVISHTGVGGLTLGGGMGWLSRRFGLTIDNLLSAEMVTADSRLVHANPEADPELFWGIRGGGGNFGVVTKFRFRMHSLGDVLIGRWSYPSYSAATALQAYNEIALEAPRQLTATFTVTADTLSVAALWSGDVGAAEPVLRRYGRLARAESEVFGSDTYLDLQSRNDTHFAWGRRYCAKGGFLDAIDGAVIDCMLEGVACAPTADCEFYVMQLGGAIADIAEDATAYSGRKANFYWLVEPVWDLPADDERCLAWARHWAKRLAALSQEGNYVNEQGDIGRQVSFDAYGAEKYQRLARLKGRVDPENLFRLNQNIEPIP
ncbi:FAD-binding oxidoreductase [Rhizobium sp. LjRoot30]|uniref:FAD-binding oxidoreductase n=1 Tax=Rhizobium sp. LjRoot30 TaxID=3342320 RepID=UPI003ECF4D43